MGILMKKVRYNGNPRLTTPAGQSKHTIRGAIVPPENLEKKHTSTIFGAPHQTTPAGKSKHTIRGAIVRPKNVGKHTAELKSISFPKQRDIAKTFQSLRFAVERRVVMKRKLSLVVVSMTWSASVQSLI